MVETVANHPTFLDASELGTKEYWDSYYQNDIDQQGVDQQDYEIPDELEDLGTWFDDCNAPSKIVEFLTSEKFALSPNHPDVSTKNPRILDLGTGNGTTLFGLRQAGFSGSPMFGVDYSQKSVDLARKLWSHFRETLDDESRSNMYFEKFDIIQGHPRDQSWWPQAGFDLVLDKGTFDAISLSSETITDGNGQQKRLCELYPNKVIEMIAPGGFLLVTSCNWTEEELCDWFLRTEGVEGKLRLSDKIQYKQFSFGGQLGSGVVSICFRRADTVQSEAQT